MTNHELLTKLEASLIDVVTTVKTTFMKEDEQKLNRKISPIAWSVLECIEHLNRYHNYYLPILENKICNAGSSPQNDYDVRYSWIGKYSIKMMDPSNLKKQKTFKRMNPAGDKLQKTVLNHFLNDMAIFEKVLNDARYVDLNVQAVNVEFFKPLKMNLGETLEFLLLHIERHLEQAIRAKRFATATDDTLVV